MTTTYRCPSPPPDEPLLSLPFVAERLGVSRHLIRRMITAGTITGYRVGPKAIRVKWSDVEAAVRIIPAAHRDHDVA